MTKLQASRPLSVLLIIFCLLTPGAFAVTEPAAGGLHFTILHTNDLHAHDESFSEHRRIVGGMAKITHLIRSIRAKDPKHVLAIDAGDIFQGTPYFKFYHGAVEVQMLNDAGYDIYTIGNHEFDDGAKNLAEQLKNAKFQIISANLDAAAVPELASEIKPSVIREIDGQKVAFVGAIVPNITEMSLGTQGVQAKATGDNWAEPIKAEVQRLKSQGVNKIILVTHIGVELDKQLAQLPDVDVIVGGHSHTRLDKPIIVHHADGSDCIVVQTGCYGRALGKLDLAFDKDGKLDISQSNEHLINITNRIYDEKDVRRYLAEKSKPFQALRNNVLAVAQRDFDKNWRFTPWDSALGDLIADALADGGSKYGATIAFENRGGIRDALDQGIISEEKVDEILPFDNKLMVATVSGQTLLNVLEHSVDKVSDYSQANHGPVKGVEGLGGHFLDTHGLKFSYDPSKPPMSRIVYALAQQADGTWNPVEKNKNYRIAINDYSFKGGEGYDFSSATNVKDTGIRLSDYLKSYLLKQKRIAPALPSRIVPVIGSVAKVVDSNSQRQLTVSYTEPGSRIYILQGTARGLQNSVHRLPVPVEPAKVVADTVGQAGSNHFHWTLPNSDKNAESGKYFAAVVVSPKKSQPPLISPPLAAF